MQTQHNPRHLLLYHLSNLTEPSDTLHQAGIGESGVTGSRGMKELFKLDDGERVLADDGRRRLL